MLLIIIEVYNKAEILNLNKTFRKHIAESLPYDALANNDDGQLSFCELSTNIFSIYASYNKKYVSENLDANLCDRTI